VVFVAPDQVAVADVTAFKQIHRIGSGFLKSEFYHYLNPTEAATPPYGLFQLTNAKEHASRRRLLARGFSMASLRQEWESTVLEKVNVAVSGMKAEAAKNGNEVDIRKWWLLLASDVVSHLMFGQSFDGLRTGKVIVGEMLQWRKR
jgi:cytochrome P450